jgi:hypothetical protein
MLGWERIRKRLNHPSTHIPIIVSTFGVTASEQALGLAWCSIGYHCSHTVGASLARVFARLIIGHIRLRAI